MRDGAEVEETYGASLRPSLELGWYFGSEAFRERLLERTREAIGQRSQAKQNYHGAEIHGYAESQARKIIAQGLLEKGLKSFDLGTLPKSHPRKIQIAKEVRTKTSVPLGFVARELRMGTPMNVSKLTNRK